MKIVRDARLCDHLKKLNLEKLTVRLGLTLIYLTNRFHVAMRLFSNR